MQQGFHALCAALTFRPKVLWRFVAQTSKRGAFSVAASKRGEQNPPGIFLPALEFGGGGDALDQTHGEPWSRHVCMFHERGEC